MRRSWLAGSPRTRPRQAMVAAPRIELVPSPEPLGSAEKIVKSSPPPSMSSQRWSDWSRLW